MTGKNNAVEAVSARLILYLLIFMLMWFCGCASQRAVVGKQPFDLQRKNAPEKAAVRALGEFLKGVHEVHHIPAVFSGDVDKSVALFKSKNHIPLWTRVIAPHQGKDIAVFVYCADGADVNCPVQGKILSKQKYGYLTSSVNLDRVYLLYRNEPISLLHGRCAFAFDFAGSRKTSFKVYRCCGSECSLKKGVKAGDILCYFGVPYVFVIKKP